MINISKYLYSLGYKDGKFGHLLRTKEMQDNIEYACETLKKPYEFFISRKRIGSQQYYFIHPYIALFVASRLHKDNADPLIKLAMIYLAKKQNVEYYSIADACLLLCIEYKEMIALLEKKRWVTFIDNIGHGMPAGIDHQYVKIDKGIVEVSSKAVDLLMVELNS